VHVNRDGWALSASYVLLERGEGDGPSPLYFLLLGVPASPVVELRVSPAGESPRSIGRTALVLGCADGSLTDTRFYCWAGDGERTTVGSFDPASGSWEPRGFLAGNLFGSDAAEAGRGRLVLTRWNETPLLLDLERGTALRPVPNDARMEKESWGMVAWQADVLAAARPSGGGDETTVSLYTLSR